MSKNDISPEKDIWFNAFVNGIRIISLLTMFFFWVPLLWGVGSMLRGEFKEGIVSIIIGIVILVVYKGGERLIEYLDEKDFDIRQ